MEIEKHTECSIQFRKIILMQFQLYPKMQVSDLYKLVYQAAMGNAHLTENPEHALHYLEMELNRVEADARLALVEPISHSGHIIRLNLQPFKRQQGDGAELGRAMLQSAREIRPSLTVLLRYWQDVESLAGVEEIPFTQDEIRAFLKQQRQQNFPPVHHSEIYRQHYKPAYRVILRKFLPESLSRMS